eukprot:7305698-Pyramimonas_sp.AAC.1
MVSDAPGLTPARTPAKIRTGRRMCSATPATAAPCSTAGVNPAAWILTMRRQPTAFFSMCSLRTRKESPAYLAAS